METGLPDRETLRNVGVMAQSTTLLRELDDAFGVAVADPDVRVIVMAGEGHPACLQGFFQVAVAQFATHEKAVETLRSGAGRPWGEHHSCQFCGTDRFFRPGYIANLLDSWLPALDGAVARALDAHHRQVGALDQTYLDARPTGRDPTSGEVDQALERGHQGVRVERLHLGLPPRGRGFAGPARLHPSVHRAGKRVHRTLRDLTYRNIDI